MQRQNHAEINTIPYLKNAVNPLFLGDFSIFGDVSGVGRAMALIGQFTLFESRAIIKEYRFLKKILGTGIATFQVAAFQQRSFYYMLDNKQRK